MVKLKSSKFHCFAITVKLLGVKAPSLSIRQVTKSIFQTKFAKSLFHISKNNLWECYCFSIYANLERLELELHKIQTGK